MGRNLVMYEYKCGECEELILLEHEKYPIYCPYCGDSEIDFAP
ncbi:hypothetical protein CHCC15325_3056 [Bacillus licheniformis]|nr:hypothetical protein [Bacillus licheniformis]HWO98655.1 hypothetical protein [Bacillus sp. (in: firmicutes)]AVI45417.1 hypothetical protein BL14DL4_00150 [Bacillus licheniformis]MCU9959243.1 hypothetical protein [Bacillus licheniformis]MEC3833605.1 hypothetical protein [Bacillus licheniformis]MED1028834.1 hypothetical protein [Bacillus licheniformis]